MHSEIHGGDVLQATTAFSRHYVFDLGGTLYVDRTPTEFWRSVDLTGNQTGRSCG